MNIEEAIYAYLTIHPTVSELAGARGYPMTIPQTAQMPCYAYQVISQTEIMDHDGLSKLFTTRVQFTCQAGSYGESKELARAIGSVLRGRKGLMGDLWVESGEVLNEFDGYGAVGGVYTTRVDVGLMYRKYGNVAGAAVPESLIIVSAPSGFTMTLPFLVQRVGSTFWPAAGWDVSDLEPVTTATMYVKPTGDDSNNGSTLILAKRTIENAISSMTQATTIWLADGLYGEGTETGYGGHWRQASPAYSVSIKAINSGQVINTPKVLGLIWSVYSGATYQATYASAVQSAWDGKTLTAEGDYVGLTAQFSIANVQANAGSWYQTGGVIYMRLADDRAPDSDLHVFRELASAYCVRDNITIYLEGIEFQGGPNGAVYFRNNSATGGLYAYAKDCKFKYSAATGGFAMEGTELSICQGCESARNQNDGFNYHVRNTVVPDAIEIDCIGRNNGTTTDADNNGSSMHDAGRICRLNGEYHDTYGPPIIDANGSLSWNMGVEAYSGLSAGVANFCVDGTMWLQRCHSHDHEATGYDLQVIGAGDALYYADITSDGDNLNGGGTLTTYTPIES